MSPDPFPFLWVGFGDKNTLDHATKRGMESILAVLELHVAMSHEDVIQTFLAGGVPGRNPESWRMLSCVTLLSSPPHSSPLGVGEGGV